MPPPVMSSQTLWSSHDPHDGQAEVRVQQVSLKQVTVLQILLLDLCLDSVVMPCLRRGGTSSPGTTPLSSHSCWNHQSREGVLDSHASRLFIIQLSQTFL